MIGLESKLSYLEVQPVLKENSEFEPVKFALTKTCATSC